jgi:predicted N-formylglutamate amidohydrolase
MMSEEADAVRPADLVQVWNREGRGRVVIACDHASNRLLPEHGTLGLDAGEFERHIAWDPGALPVSLHLSKLLDAPVVAGGLSRLVIDCNRPFDAPDLIPEVSETTVIPGNAGLDAEARRKRIELAHKPFHDAIDDVLSRRLRHGMETWLISIHSFTPVYKDIPRPWQIGILHDDDERLSRPMIEAFGVSGGIVVGDNQPYSPADRVYYTLERHARSRGLPCAMIEIRNDEIADAAGQRRWADRLAAVLAGIATVENTIAARPADARRTGSS